jgi:magnesium transporter
MVTPSPAGELSHAVWIDLFQPSDEELARVKAATGLRVPTQHDIEEIESTSRLGFEGGAFYVSAPLSAGPAGFVVSAKVLLTVHYTALPELEPIADLKSAEDAFLRLVERMVDRTADELERAGAEADGLSHRAFGEHQKGATLSAALRRLGTVADRTSHLRDMLLGVGRLTAFVAESSIAGAPSLNARRLKAIRADVVSLTDYEAHLATKIQFLLDATLGFINIEQNDIVKTLTIASVVGIPPVLIAGIYGMNFHVMPELNWPYGYPFALGLIVVSALLPLIWFKRRGWI